MCSSDLVDAMQEITKIKKGAAMAKKEVDRDGDSSITKAAG